MPPTLRDILAPRPPLPAPPTTSDVQAARDGDAPLQVPWPPACPSPRGTRATRRRVLGRREATIAHPPPPPPPPTVARLPRNLAGPASPDALACRLRALRAHLAGIPDGGRRSLVARAVAAEHEAQGGKPDYVRRVAAVLERLLTGPVGEAFDALCADPEQQRRLAREAVQYVGLELLVPLPPERCPAPRGTRGASSPAQRRAGAAHALMMLHGLASPVVRRVLKPARPNALVPREVASDLVYFARTVVAEVATGVPWATCVLRLCAGRSPVRPSLRQALQAAADVDLELERCALGLAPEQRALRRGPLLRRRRSDPCGATLRASCAQT